MDSLHQPKTSNPSMKCFCGNDSMLRTSLTNLNPARRFLGCEKHGVFSPVSTTNCSMLLKKNLWNGKTQAKMVNYSSKVRENVGNREQPVGVVWDQPVLVAFWKNRENRAGLRD